MSSVSCVRIFHVHAGARDSDAGDSANGMIDLTKRVQLFVRMNRDPVSFKPFQFSPDFEPIHVLPLKVEEEIVDHGFALLVHRKELPRLVLGGSVREAEIAVAGSMVSK